MCRASGLGPRGPASLFSLPACTGAPRLLTADVVSAAHRQTRRLKTGRLSASRSATPLPPLSRPLDQIRSRSGLGKPLDPRLVASGPFLCPRSNAPASAGCALCVIHLKHVSLTASGQAFRPPNKQTEWQARASSALVSPQLLSPSIHRTTHALETACIPPKPSSLCRMVQRYDLFSLSPCLPLSLTCKSSARVN